MIESNNKMNSVCKSSKYIKLTKAVCFVLIFVIIFCLLERTFYSYAAVSEAWDIVQDNSAEPLDILFMGGSHVFCSINPVILNEATGLNTAILGSSAQPITVTYENLRTVLKYQTPPIIVLEVAGSFHTQNQADSILSDKIGYIYNNADGIDNVLLKARNLLGVIDIKNIAPACFQLFRPTSMWDRWANLDSTSRDNVLGHKQRKYFVKSDVDLVVSENELESFYSLVDSSSSLLPEYVEAFNKFMKLAEEKNIAVYLMSAPLTEYSESYVGELIAIEEMAKQYSSFKGLYDFGTQMTDIQLEIDDFCDATHLNMFGACKFTKYFAENVLPDMGIKPDVSRVNYYLDNTVEYIEDGLCRYTVQIFGNSLVAFRVIEDGVVVVETKYSEQNWIDYPPLSENQRIRFFLKPIVTYDNTMYPEKKGYAFTFLQQ